MVCIISTKAMLNYIRRVIRLQCSCIQTYVTSHICAWCAYIIDVIGCSVMPFPRIHTMAPHLPWTVLYQKPCQLPLRLDYTDTSATLCVAQKSIAGFYRQIHVHFRTGIEWNIARRLNSSGFSVIMMTSSNGNIFRVTGPLCGPVTRSFDAFFDLRLNKRLNKQSRRRWFDTPSWSLWRHCNDYPVIFPKANSSVQCLLE